MALNKYKYIVLIFSIVGINSVYSQNISIDGVTDKTSSAAKNTDSTKVKQGHFIPVPFIITDKNIGYGALLSLGYLQKNRKSTRENTPITISGITAGYTTTDTWAVAIGETHSFNNDKTRYLGALFYTSANLNFYNIGSLDISSQPIKLNIKAAGTFQRVIFRLGNTNFFLGPQYNLANITTSFNISDNSDHPLIDTIITKIDDLQNQIWLSEIGLYFDYDNRDNTMSPKKGIHTGIKLEYNSTYLGATKDFHEEELFFYAYVPFTKWLYSIYHIDGTSTGGNTPIYMKPYVELRGAPALRYQGDNSILGEMQLRAKIYKPINIVGFVGAGKAFDEFKNFSKPEWIVNYGTGFRWELKKTYDLRLGVDFAWTNNNDFGWYIVIGTGL